jgi:Flp pilus assembly pilin Flp
VDNRIKTMKQTLARLWREQDGSLSFEWTLVLTLLVIGIVAGLAAARDAIIDEFGDAAQAMLSIDQSYTIAFPLLVVVHDPAVSSASDSAFTDALFYVDCGRSTTPAGQAPQTDADGLEVTGF